MRQFIEDFIEPIVISGLILFVILLCFLLSWTQQAVNADALRSLGYEAKTVNFTCYAKYKERWVGCGAVIDHQYQLIH